MKVGFIGLGRMGEVMTRRLLDAGHEVGVYNRNGGQGQAAGRCRRQGGQLDQGGRAVRRRGFHHGVRRRRRAPGGRPAGRPQGLAAERRHSHLRRHAQRRAIQKLKAMHAEAGQVLIASPVLGRPEVVTAGQAGMCSAAPPERVDRCRPLFTAIAPRCRRGRRRSGRRRRRSRSPTISCSAAPSRRSARVSRWCANTTWRPEVFFDVLTDRPVQLLGLQELRQDHRRSKISAGGPARHERPEGRQSRARRRRSGRRAACRAVTSGAIVWSALSLTARASTTGR